MIPARLDEREIYHTHWDTLAPPCRPSLDHEIKCNKQKKRVKVDGERARAAGLMAQINNVGVGIRASCKGSVLFVSAYMAGLGNNGASVLMSWGVASLLLQVVLLRAPLQIARLSSGQGHLPLGNRRRTAGRGVCISASGTTCMP